MNDLINTVVPGLVSVIIVNFNGERYIRECLESVCSQIYSPIEIIVVDNASEDNSVEIITKSFNGVKLIRLENNRGFAEGNTIGFSQSRGEFIALLNNDAIADAEWISELLGAITKKNAAACVAKILSYENRNRIDSAGDGYTRMGFPFRIGHGSNNNHRYMYEKNVFSVSGAAVLYRRSVLEELGFFDDCFFCYLEDVDLSLRMKHAGYTLYYIPSAVAYHVGSSSTGSEINRKIMYYVTKNYIPVLVKNLPAKLLFLYMPYILFFLVYWMWFCLKKKCIVSYFKGLYHMLSVKNSVMLLKKRACQKRFWKRSAGDLDKEIRRSEYDVFKDLYHLRRLNSTTTWLLKKYLELFHGGTDN